MAAADYRSCDVCKGKTFYDAELDYKECMNAPSYGAPMPEGDVGDWAVLCSRCALVHKIEIVQIDCKALVEGKGNG